MNYSYSQISYIFLALTAVTIATVGYWYWSHHSNYLDSAVVYKRTAGSWLKLHLLPPSATTAESPSSAILLFHGGAWSYGSAAQFAPQCRAFADAGIYCVSAEYRLGASHGTTPAEAIDDALDAFLWLQANAASLNIDPARIAVGGGSAGGHLAAMVGIKAAALSPMKTGPSAAILYNPMLDLAPGMPDHELVSAYWESVSPYHNLASPMVDSLILMGDRDEEISVATAQAYASRVEQLGGRCEIEVYPGADHGFFNQSQFDGRYFTATNTRVLTFLSARGLSPTPPAAP